MSGNRVACVVVSGEALAAMLMHALTTEREEVMGLLLGVYLPYNLASLPPTIARAISTSTHTRRHSKNNHSSGSETTQEGKKETSAKDERSVVVWVRGTHVFPRKAKTADRVEVSDAELTAASQYAESSGQSVVGWYHSHPHITIHPSHVDVNTQALYQLMDQRFVGLIVSAFDHTRGRLGLIAFQSPHAADRDKSTAEREDHHVHSRVTGPAGEVIIPVYILRDSPDNSPASSASSNALQTISSLLSILAQEEREAYLSSLQREENTHPLVALHSAATYEKALVRLLEYCAAPLLTHLAMRCEANRQRIEELKAQLQEKIKLKS